MEPFVWHLSDTSTLTRGILRMGIAVWILRDSGTRPGLFTLRFTVSMGVKQRRLMMLMLLMLLLMLLLLMLLMLLLLMLILMLLLLLVLSTVWVDRRRTAISIVGRHKLPRLERPSSFPQDRLKAVQPGVWGGRHKRPRSLKLGREELFHRRR